MTHSEKTTLIRNGQLVTANRIYTADLLIIGDKIARIEGTLNINADIQVDATGMLVLPGGIDPHVHLNLPTPAGYSADSFQSGTIAALYGGTTTLIDFVTPKQSETLTEALNKRLTEAANAHTDFSLHISPISWSKSTKNEIARCIQRGFPSFKVYMAYKDTIGLDDQALFRVMQAVAELNGMITVHCELGDEIEHLRNQYAEQGHTVPKYHSLSRPESTEEAAVKRAITLARQAGCPLYIVHVSTGKALEHIKHAQNRGQTVWAETCPQYLTLDESLYSNSFDIAATGIMSPPLRHKRNNELLWKGINKSIIKTVGTDHCPFTLKQKQRGLSDFRLIPNGAGGVEHRLGLLYTFGVRENRITLPKLVKIFAENPARIFGLYPQKGTLTVGSDADLVIWNPQIRRTISATNHHSKSDISVYEGITVYGKAEYVLLRGNIMIANGTLTDNPPHGRLIERPPLTFPIQADIISSQPPA